MFRNILKFSKKIPSRTISNFNRNMAKVDGDKEYKGEKLEKVVEILHLVAPVESAESWDNVGLLVEPSSER